MSLATIMVDGCDTLPKLFLKKSAERGDRSRCARRTSASGRAIRGTTTAHEPAISPRVASLGLQRGDVVSIQSEDCREWLWADVGAMLAGGVVNGIYPTYQSRQVEHALTIRAAGSCSSKTRSSSTSISRSRTHCRASRKSMCSTGAAAGLRARQGRADRDALRARQEFGGKTRG